MASDTGGTRVRDGIHQVFGIPIWNQSLEAATQETVDVAARGERRSIYFVNAHCVNVAARNPDYYAVLKSGGRVYADGSGLAIASFLCGDPLHDNVNGTDMFPLLCEAAAARGIPIALLGAAPGVASTCAANMKTRFPGLDVAFVEDGYFDRSREGELIDRLNRSGAKILLVAFGVPLQELWIHHHANQIQVPVLLAVGGLFDFYSGLRRRAPWILRKTGMEWTFRLMQEPKRLFGRYIFGNPEFLLRAAWLRFKGKDRLAFYLK